MIKKMIGQIISCCAYNYSTNYPGYSRRIVYTRNCDHLLCRYFDPNDPEAYQYSSRPAFYKKVEQIQNKNAEQVKVRIGTDDTTDIMLDVNPYCRALRGHELSHKALWYKTWLRFKVWLAESCRNHDAGIKTQAIKAKLFVKTGDKLSAKLWGNSRCSEFKNSRRSLARTLPVVNPYGNGGDAARFHHDREKQTELSVQTPMLQCVHGFIYLFFI